MREYVVKDKTFTTICSVHDEINNVVLKLGKERLSDEILSELLYINKLTNTAKEMGQNMEDALKYSKFGDYSYSNIFHFNKLVGQIFSDMEGEE